MKKIVVSLVSAVVIVMIVAIANRLTITTTTRINEQLTGDGWVKGTLHVEERLVLTGETLRVDEKDYSRYDTNLQRFLLDERKSKIKFGFR